MGSITTGSGHKVAMVTGAAQGIGRALARQLAADGVVLGLIDNKREALNATAEELRSSTTVETFHADVRDPVAMERATATMCEKHGQLDLFINNAGVGILGEVRDHELEDWREVVDTNLYGTIHGVHAAYRRMIAQGSGHIVNMGSLAGGLPLPGNIAYVASKAAVMNLTLALRSEAELHGIGVTLVMPMAVSTTMLAEAKSLRIDAEAARREFVGPSITPEECARQILRGVARNQAVVRPHLAKVLWFFHRFCQIPLGFFYRKVTRTVARLRQADTADPNAPSPTANQAEPPPR